MKVSVSCLGGVGEIGMNMYVYETEKFVLIVDCGVKFARSDEPGIDIIIPDFSYIESVSHKKILLAATHAHEDHIGAIPYLIKKFPEIIISAGKYTYEIIKSRLNEHNINPDYVILENNSAFEWGDFEITPYSISHSIHGTFALKIKTADGFTFMHMSDYKIDTSPVTADPFPVKDFIQAGINGVNCLLADSTNILNQHFTQGEYSTRKHIEDIFKSTNGRIFFTTFASNTERLQTVFDMAEKFGRYTVIEGSSLAKHIDTARKMGKVKINDEFIIKRKNIDSFDDSKICVIATGSQGESTSVISRISQNDYSSIKVKEGDVFIFSSRVIPGSEHYIIKVINNIYTNGGTCITVDDKPVHVSGHASKADALLLLKILRPDYLLPVHGEVRHITAHRNMAVEDYGMSEENALLWTAGKKITFNDGVINEIEDITAGKMFVDVNTQEILDTDKLKVRKRLSSDGVVAVVLTENNIENLNEKNIFISCVGFSIENEYINILKKDIVEKKLLEENLNENLNDYITKTVKRFFKKRFLKRPVIEIINIKN